MDMSKVGGQIAMFRKERGLTQDALAEQLGISPQAVSKWENGHTLPETALLPDLSKILDCSIDTLLVPGDLQILEAVLTDGVSEYNVTSRLNKYVEGSKLSIPINEQTLSVRVESDKLWFVLVKYKLESYILYKTGKLDGEIVISREAPGQSSPEKPMIIIDAYYGNIQYSYNAMQKIKHYEFFKPDRYHANHESFPSNPMASSTEYLSIIYLNDTGLHVAVCNENESLAISADGRVFDREPEAAVNLQIPGVEALTWNNRMDCSWAGALTVALRAMGHLSNLSLEDAFIRVMGVSGACYRLAFSSPTWDYSSVDGLVAFDYAAPAYKAFGYTPVFADRVDKKDREIERNNILKSLRHHRPVLAINLRVAPEWGVITGYEDNGKTLLCRTYYDKEIIVQEYAGVDRYLNVDNWPFIITHFGQNAAVPSDCENLSNSIRVMIESFNTPSAGGYSMGYNAYDTWAADLRDDSRFRVDDETFWRLYSVNHFCMMALTDARRCAWRYLEESAAQQASVCEGITDKRRDEILTRISDDFKQIHGEVSRIYSQLHDLCPSDAPKAKGLWPRELRLEQAAVFDRVKVLERDAETLGREYLDLE